MTPLLLGDILEGEKVNIKEIAEGIEKPWTPVVVAGVDDYHAHLGMIYGKYDFHKHNKDVFFLVVKGEIDIDVGDRTVHLKENEGIVIKANTIHRSKSKDKSVVMLFEAKDQTIIKV